MARTPEQLVSGALVPRYSRFRVGERVLLTGHSHQAWPDVAEEGLLESFADAAELADGKWGRAFAKADAVRRGFARLLGDDDSGANIALGASTHELVIRFLSALPLRARPRLVTSDGEFHSLRRQLARLEEEGVEVVRVASSPLDTFAERVAAAIDDRTAAALVSSVLFRDARIVPNLAAVATSCERHGAELLVDAYHHINIVPFDLHDAGLTRAFVTGGGYKYTQLGEGVCFLRIPPGCTLRPVVTGWFAEYALLGAPVVHGHVAYPEGAAAFAGATYDPASHYRAARVFDFFAHEGLTTDLLRRTSQLQITHLAAGIDALDLDPAALTRAHDKPLTGIGGFLALRSPNAAAISAALNTRGVHSDHRADILRLGPAPYLTLSQLDHAVAALREIVAP